MKKSCFIVFEGIEGCGKSTQIKLLKKQLSKEGYSVVVTQEPGGTAFGLNLRKLLLHSKEPINNQSEMLLYMASRSQLVEQVIYPALHSGKIVLCDRWLDSTLAYQGYGLGLSIPWIKQVAKGVIGDIKPDRTFYLDCQVKTGLARAAKRGALDRIESRHIQFHRKVRKGYIDLCRSGGKRISISEKNINDTHEEISCHVQRLLG